MEVCFTKDELSVISRKAKKAGLSIGGFVRRSVADKEIKEAPPADIPMLLACRRQVLVNPSRKLKTNPRLDGAECLYPSTPWRNSLEKKWEIALFVMGMIRLSDE